MKSNFWQRGFFTCLTIVTLIGNPLTSCKKDNKTDAENPVLKIGLVTGFGKITDKGFNQQAYEAVGEAVNLVGGTWEYKESSSVTDIQNNISYFTSNKFDVIVTLTYDAAEATVVAAAATPQSRFILLDYSPVTIPSNLSCVVFAVDQAAFPCGFLAAYRAYQQDPQAAKVGYVAGPKILPIDQFTKSFTAGVSYFNSQYGKQVGVSGVNAPSFTDTIMGAYLADSLIQQGADVIFACAGTTGNGALTQVKKLGKSAIGVDTDQFLTIPWVGSVLLTSCMKNLRSGIINGIQSVKNGQFQGGITLTSTLAEGGVGLAPYHDFESQIPDSVKAAVNEIRTKIINGSLSTGWPK